LDNKYINFCSSIKDFPSVSVDPTESDLAPLKSDFSGKSDSRGYKSGFVGATEPTGSPPMN
jgi:hypothetical protein